MLGQYFAAIWSDWTARMSGLASLIFTALGVYSHIFIGTKGATNAAWFFGSAAILCLLLANYRVWLDEHRKRVSSEPSFMMAIEAMHYEYAPANDNTVIILAIYLLNQGAPSISRGWRGFYEIAASIEEMRLIHIQQWTIRSANELVNLSAADQITSKTMERRMETGEAKTGRLFFTIPGDRADQIRSLNFSLKIHCHDFLGKQYVAKFVPAPEPLTGVPIYPNEMGQVLSTEPVEGALGFPPPNQNSQNPQ